MKKLFFALFVCFSIITLLASTCKKDDAPAPPAPGPDVLDIKEGLLSTKSGVNYANLGDTAYIRMKGSTNTGGNLTIEHTYQKGKYESQDWYMDVTASGNNYVYIRNKKDGYYLGINPSSGVAAGYHPWGRNWPSIDKNPGPNNRFLLKKKGDHFTLECYEHKGLFLNSTLVSQISYTGPKTELEVHFLEKEQEWFFLKPF
jgi:hypothetical protein